MSTRIALTLGAVSLFAAVGCATGEDIEGGEPESSGTEETSADTAEMPELQLDVEEEATGCSGPPCVPAAAITDERKEHYDVAG